MRPEFLETTSGSSCASGARGPRPMVIPTIRTMTSASTIPFAIRNGSSGRRRGRVAGIARRRPGITIGRRCAGSTAPPFFQLTGRQWHHTEPIPRRAARIRDRTHGHDFAARFAAALLAAEAAMRLDEPLGLDAGRQPDARHRRQMRPESFDDAQRIDRNFRHARLPCPLVHHGHSGTAATTLPAPVRRAPAGTSGRSPGSARRSGSSYRNPSSCSTTVRSRTISSEA